MDKRITTASSLPEKEMEKALSTNMRGEQKAPGLVKLISTKTANTKKDDIEKIPGLGKDRNTEDLLLWVKIKAGEIEALGSLYDLYIDVLYPYGFSIAKDRVLVMDSIHDLFMDIFKYRKKLADSPQVKFYLLKSLKRKLFKKGKTNPAFDSTTGEKHFFDHNIFESSTEKKLIDIENDVDKQRQIQHALSSLTKKQKRAVELKFYEGRSYEEIAILMNVTIATSRTLIYRSITSLRNKLAVSIFLLCTAL